MIKVAYYISDYGWGHAARSICIIEKLLEYEPELRVIVCTKQPMPFLEAALSNIIDMSYEQEQVSFHPIQNDVGFVSHEITGQVDLVATCHKVNPWVYSWNDYLRSEYKFLKRQKVDMIISDIPPQPFLLAEKLKCPGIAITNFSWVDQYPKHHFPQALLERLREAYAKATLAFVLPFNFELEVFRSRVQTPLVARNPTRTPTELRQELGIESHQFLVYIGVGLSVSNPFVFETVAAVVAARKDEIVFLASGKMTASQENVYKVPLDDPNGQDFIACSDLALLKPAYSSVAEAIRSKTPILSYNIAQSREGYLIEHQIITLGFAQAISRREFNTGEWIKKIDIQDDLRKNYAQIPPRFQHQGETFVAAQILKLLEN
ncbi:MAG: glycosyltransferase family protein [Candidatus Heimdallarchaeota archaeon]